MATATTKTTTKTKTKAKTKTEEEKKKYNFGEKKQENINGKKLPVTFITPKYKEARKKVIELLESDKYKNVLEESDFWILVNTYDGKSKAMYSGLIISHDGCLKINDVLEEKLKFKPACMSLDKEGYNNSLVYSYICPEQGLYEVGEVSKDNCKNDYPYAMALKRCFDRVVLKNSRIAYSGIYSDSESDEFLKRTDDSESNTTEKKTTTKTTTKKENTTKTSNKEEKTIPTFDYKTALIEKLKELNININQYAKVHKLNVKTTQLEAKVLLEKLENGVLE